IRQSMEVPSLRATSQWLSHDRAPLSVAVLGMEAIAHVRAVSVRQTLSSAETAGVGHWERGALLSTTC
ncbi:hypothetical protein, partial [Rhizobium sp. PEPV16]|uniref:hypothetical protein n=1 Tax=Rhizobium sp. PEPV16 TaxID=1820614 RepID=UPI001AEF6654